MRKDLCTYHALNAGQAALGVAFHFLLARRFGAGAETDVFFLSTVLVGFLTLIGTLFSEMFLQHYCLLQARDPGDASEFYQAAFTHSILLGALGVAIGIASFPLIARFFTPGFDESRIALFRGFFFLHCGSLLLGRAVGLNNSLLNAHMRFFLPYLLSIVMQVVNIAFLLAFSDRWGIRAVAAGSVAGTAIAFAVQALAVPRLVPVRMKLRLWHPAVRPMAAGSASLRLGYQVWSLRDVITANVLSRLPEGSVSVFFYAMRIASILFTVTSSPILQIFQSKASCLSAEGKKEEVAPLRRQAIVQTVVLFGGAVLATAILLPELLNRMFREVMSVQTRDSIYYLFLAVVPVHLLMAFEAPYLQTVIAIMRGDLVLKISAVFIAVYFFSARAMGASWGLFGLAAAMAAAQTINFLLYVHFVERR